MPYLDIVSLVPGSFSIVTLTEYIAKKLGLVLDEYIGATGDWTKRESILF